MFCVEECSGRWFADSACLFRLLMQKATRPCTSQQDAKMRGAKFCTLALELYDIVCSVRRCPELR